MTITTQTLKDLGYSQEKANSIFSQMGVYIPTVTKLITITSNRNGKVYPHQCNIRHMDLNDAILLCESRIKAHQTNQRVNIEQWSELLGKLLEYRASNEQASKKEMR